MCIKISNISWTLYTTFVLQYVQKEMLDCEMAPLRGKVGSKSACKKYGAQCVMMGGVMLTLLLSAGSWDFQLLVRCIAV